MSTPIKEAVNLRGLAENLRVAQDLRRQQSGEGKDLVGIAGERIIEPVPHFIETPSEKVIKNENNAWIVLGRDRPQSIVSGYAGRGDTQAAAIDIVVGRLASIEGGPIAVFADMSGKEQPVYCNPDYINDAARIYISQKTDVDLNFKLAAGRVGSPGFSKSVWAGSTPNSDKSSPRSAIALKADGIRLIAREGIKLVTRTDAKNSQGSKIQGIRGIDIIAGNDDSDLQPMVKGDNLIEALEALRGNIDALNGVVDAFLNFQTKFNKAVGEHFHISPFEGAMTDMGNGSFTLGIAVKSVAINNLTSTKKSLQNHKLNLDTFKRDFLKQSGEKYINSSWNHVN